MFTPPQSPADAEAIRGAKQELRRAVLQRRRVRTAKERESFDQQRFERFTEFVGDAGLRTAACYVSTSPEPATLQVIAWLAARQTRVLLPVITEPAQPADLLGDPDLFGAPALFGDPAWADYAGPDHLHTGRLSIIEPTTPVLPAEVLAAAEVIIVPGLAANRQGRRLGRGGGWYDRALTHAATTAVVVQFAYDDELLEVIPTHPWDRRVDVVITPTRIVSCQD